MYSASEVWYVRGDTDKILLLTKEDAEKHARYLFPDEGAVANYSRVYFKTVYTYKQEN